MTQEEIINRLKEGNKRFSADSLEAKQQDQKRRDEILDGQDPIAIILSCSDSRIVPELAFDMGLGELFIVRVAGNIANASSIASIEYAVAHLHTTVLIVLGHDHCGAVTAAVNGEGGSPHLDHLMDHLQAALKIAGPDADLDKVIRNNTHLTVKKLMKDSQIIAEAVNNQKLKIYPAHYHLKTGKVEFINASNSTN